MWVRDIGDLMPLDRAILLLPFHGSTEASSENAAPQACLIAAAHQKQMMPSSSMPLA